MSRPPEELSALVGKEVLPYHYVKLTNNPNGSVGATGIYVNLTNKVVLPNETTAGFLQCDISIAQPWYADSRTTAVVEGEAFTIATVKDVVERDNGARTTFILDATRSHLDETQTVRMDCAAGGMSVLAYVSESDIFIR